jgi:hypothetical protein
MTDWQRLPRIAGGTFGRGMGSDVLVENLAGSDLYDHEERGCGILQLSSRRPWLHFSKGHRGRSPQNAASWEFRVGSIINGLPTIRQLVATRASR